MVGDAAHGHVVKVERLKELLILRATGGSPDEQEYADLRRELGPIRDALPELVRRCTTVREFWYSVKDMFETDKYRRRTQYIQDEFMPILEALGGGRPLPGVAHPPRPDAEARPRPDVVVMTVNEHETRAVHDAFLEATGAEGMPVSIEGRTYHDLGSVNGTAVFHAISEMGSSGQGGMQQAVDRAIRALDPGAVVAVGIAFGVSKKNQAIGEILLSRQIQAYEMQRVGEDIVLRGDKPHATPRLINYFETFNQIKWRGARVRAGLILSGEKLIDSVDYRDRLVRLQPEAVGGEMEGAGLYVSSADHKVDWIVVKSICDWADGSKRYKKEERQRLAAKNAAEFLVSSLKYMPLSRVDCKHLTSDNAISNTGSDGMPPFSGPRESSKRSDPSAAANASDLIATYRRRLAILEKQTAAHGSLTPPHITMEIEDITRIITELER